jgi:hypothetical protein
MLDALGRERNGDWIQTFTGKQIFPADPVLNVYDIVDIAAALSKLTRYNGHCLRFYSVAEHCVLMARKAQSMLLPLETCRAMLLHDASEAYLIDVPRPVKPLLGGYFEIEAAIMHEIAGRFCFAWPLEQIVKDYDTNILNDEMMQTMAPPPSPWRHGGECLGVTLQHWTPERAFAEFMREAAMCRACIT